MSEDILNIGAFEFRSRLFTGTGKYPDLPTAKGALEASGCEVVTVAVRRVDLQATGADSIMTVLREGNYTLLPNTAGCYTAEDAVRTARLARELLDTTLVKLEVLGDEKTLFPDVPATLEAAKTLVDDGFTVLPYFNDDPVAARRLEDLGCAAVMPLAAPIGSGLGVRNPFNIEIIVKHANVPVIVDAGVGTASDAAIAMELGIDGVLLNTAVAEAKHPVQMARAMRLAAEAGRLAYRAGRISKRLYASASSPLDGTIDTDPND